MYDLINIFEVFLPQLLLYPNPTDPLNGDAARLLLKDSGKYNEKVKEYVKFYAMWNLSFKSTPDKKEVNTNNISNGKSTNNNNENAIEKSKINDNKEDDSSVVSELSNASIEVEDS